MREKIFSLIKNDLYARTAYIFILAWNDVLNEKRRRLKENLTISSDEESIDHKKIVEEHIDRSNLPRSLWDDEEIGLKQLMIDAREFLYKRLNVDKNDSKMPHTIMSTTRKNEYPIQMDIVEYIATKYFANTDYRWSDIQSFLSRKLSTFMGVDKKTPSSLAESSGLIIRVNREYKPFSIQDKRASMIGWAAKNIDCVNEYGVRIFAKLAKKSVYNIGNGGAILFFEDQDNLSGIHDFLRKFVGEPYVCDTFDVKGRLFVLIDGTTKEIEEALQQLAELIDTIYAEQNKPVKLSLKKT